MKTINVTFEDDEFNALLKIKDNRSWRDFILTLVKRDPKESRRS
jgi:predicted CopG family antitoxin